MVLAVCIIAIVLGVVALVSFAVAFERGDKSDAGSLGGGKRFSVKWLCTSIFAAVLGVLLIVFGFTPALVHDLIGEAETITRKTFREKLGREPDKIHFDGINRKTNSDGWKYVGTAHVGGEVWDVTVTRSNDESARTTRLQCEASPRK